MEIITKKDLYQREYSFLTAGRVKGRNYLAKLGFSQCQNPDYMQREEIYMHYNKIIKGWIGDTVILSTNIIN